MKMAAIIKRGTSEFVEIAGAETEKVTQVAKCDEGWRLGIEVLEMRRIPSATDLLGLYELFLSENGDLLRFKRTKTRLRGEPTEEDDGGT